MIHRQTADGSSTLHEEGLPQNGQLLTLIWSKSNVPKCCIIISLPTEQAKTNIGWQYSAYSARC
jgi:hypothetical protein